MARWRAAPGLYWPSRVVLLALLSFLSCGVQGQQSNSIQRFGHSAVVLPNQSILVFGGYNFVDLNYAALQYEGLKNDLLLITVQPGGPAQISSVTPVSGPVPKARMLHMAAFKNTSAGTGIGALVIQGGTPLNYYAQERSTIYRACAMNDMWAFDLSNLTWTRLWPVNDSDLQLCRGARPHALGAAIALVMLLFLLG